MSFAPWVTHGVELRAFIARKMPRSMHNMRPYIGKELHHFRQKDIHPSGVTRGAPCSYFTSNVKIPHTYRQDTLAKGKVLCLRKLQSQKSGSRSGQ